MCVVSFVSDRYGEGTGWPPPGVQPIYPVPYPTQPIVAPLKPLELEKIAPSTLPWTKETLDMMKEILAALKKLDAALGLANCEDPKKAEWIQAVEKRIKESEKPAKKKKKRAKKTKPQLLNE
jgi:thiamine pyrophosphate-dependent acetolactate synthase large subunit-like protein